MRKPLLMLALLPAALPAAAHADVQLADKTVADATGGAAARVQLWQRSSDGAVYPRVWVSDTKADGICAHAAVLWHHVNGKTYTDYGSWVCGPGQGQGPADKPARNWRHYRSVSLAAFVDGRDPVPVGLYDFGALRPPSEAPDSSEDKDCSKPRTVTARFSGRVYGHFMAVKERGRSGRLRPTGRKVSERFKIGSVQIGLCTRGWDGNPLVKVDSKGLTQSGRPKAAAKHGIGAGWGVVIKGWRNDNGLLTINVVQCRDNLAAQVRDFNEMFGLGATVKKLPHPISMTIGIATYLAGKRLPPAGVDCVTLSEHDFRIYVTGDRARLSHVDARGRYGPARTGPETGGRETSIREVLMAYVETDPGAPKPPRRRPGRQP